MKNELFKTLNHNTNCKTHDLKLTTFCSHIDCENYFLCDFCLNSHDRTHKYLFSTEALEKNYFSNILIKNEEKATKYIINPC